MSTLCLDLGATYIKAARFSPAGEILESARVDFPPFLETSGPRREVSTREILLAVEKAFGQLRPEVGKKIKIMVSCQMQGFVLVNAVSKQALSHFISWQDGRCLKYWGELNRIIDAPARERLGNEWKAGHGASTWFALRREGDLPRSAQPLSLGDYVILSLTGRVPRMHATNAAGFGCWNVSHAKWDQDVLGALELTDISLPEASSEVSRVAESELGVFHSCVGDQQAALLGSGLGASQISVNVATGSQVSCLSQSSQTGTDFQVRPYFDGCYLRTITHLPAGRAVNFLLGAFGTEIGDVAIPTGFRSDLKVNLCFFPGSLGDRGAVENIHENNFTKEDVLFAAYDFMSSAYAGAGLRLDPRHEKTEILGSGGMLLKSSLLRGMIEEKMARKFAPSNVAEDALFGLFKLSELDR